MATKKKSKKKPATRKSSPKKKAAVKKKASGTRKKQAAQAGRKRARGARRSEYPVPRAGRGALSGRQSGDLQGLSTREDADSESVDELLEEGNAFEAGVVEGVEGAGSQSEREVHTREVPEDDVPEEYLDKDS
jgi:hypothetical protein